jgi:3-dehydroquinate synthase
MTTIKSNTYNIFIEQNGFMAIQKFLTKKVYDKYVIICDENSSQYCLPQLLLACETLKTAEIIEIESGEKNKTIETCIQVWGALTDIGADKKSLIINLGGGVISDLGGFVASAFKRGIDFINIPTTLLSMVDASVGGKTGIDFEGIKNHIGSTYEPKGVFINIAFLESLSERHIKNGYAEIIKIALIADNSFWNALKKIKRFKEFYSKKIIIKAIELKNNIVKKDLKEIHLRKSLNFGHNVGHALESSFIKQNKDILHGEAIAFGMLIESEIAFDAKKISRKELGEIKKYINSIYKKISLSSATKKLLLEFILHDKKNEGSHLCFALPKSIGKFELYCDVKIVEIENAMNKK